VEILLLLLLLMFAHATKARLQNPAVETWFHQLSGDRNLGHATAAAQLQSLIVLPTGGPPLSSLQRWGAWSAASSESPPFENHEG
jgi:hypothetical protein